MTILIYGDEYCTGLIKACFTSADKNSAVGRSKIKKLILQKIQIIEDTYGLHKEELCSDILFDFLSKSKILKIDNDRGSPTTFILQYVFNTIRNIEKKLRRGTYYSNNGDVMSKLDRSVDLIDNESILEAMTGGIDNNDPESLLIQQEMLANLYQSFTDREVESIASGNNISEELKVKLNSFKADWLG